MGLKEDFKDLKNEVQDLNVNSIALELLKDFKKQNKRMFVILIIVLVMWFCTIGAFLYYINTVDYEEDIRTQDIDDIESLDGANITNGDIYGKN